MTLVAFLKLSKNSWYVSNLFFLHQNTDAYASHITWVSPLLPSNLNMNPLTRFRISIMFWLHSIASYFLSRPNLTRRISVHCPWRIVNTLFRFYSRIFSLSGNFFILASKTPFWTIVSAVFTASESGYVGKDSIGLETFLTEYCTSLPLFCNLIPQM